MLKASALYIVIAISLIIAVSTASFIAVAYYYRLEYQKTQRYQELLSNLNSGTAILLSEDYLNNEEQRIDLYGEGIDSIYLQQEKWGLFTLAAIKSFKNQDTLKKAFFIGRETKQDKTVLYLADEDRPLSVSGTTRITGEALLPKAGIRQAYVEGRPYSGKELVYGPIKTSGRKLPALNEEILSDIKSFFEPDSSIIPQALPDSAVNSFFNPPLVLKLGKSASAVNNEVLQGKIILLSDTLIHISKSAVLNDVIVYAPAISVEDGFKGNCQLFASDSIIIGKNADFNYPSCAGIIKREDSDIQPKVSLGAGTEFSGILFSYEKERSSLQMLISLGKNCLVKGEVFVSGLLKMERPVTVEGKVSCTRFVIQTPVSLYENYLIDIVFNREKRNPYYLSSSLFYKESSQKSILKWLD